MTFTDIKSKRGRRTSGTSKPIKKYLDSVEYVVMEGESREEWMLFCSESKARRMSDLGVDVKFTNPEETKES